LPDHDHVIAPDDDDSETQRKTQQKNCSKFNFVRHLLMTPTRELISIVSLDGF
jgi:hypothetical protein